MSIRLLPETQGSHLQQPAAGLMERVKQRELQIRLQNYDQRPGKLICPLIVVVDEYNIVKLFTASNSCAGSIQDMFDGVSRDMVQIAQEDALVRCILQNDELIIQTAAPLAQLPRDVVLDPLEAVCHSILYQNTPLWPKYHLYDAVKAACIRAGYFGQVQRVHQFASTITHRPFIVPTYGLLGLKSSKIVTLDDNLKISALKRFRYFDFTRSFAQDPLAQMNKQLLRSRFVKGVGETRTAQLEQRDLWEQANELGAENVCQKFTTAGGK